MSPEFSRPLAVDRLGSAPFEQSVAARPEELAPLALRLRIPAVHSLSCRFRLRRVAESVIEAEGVLQAEVEQVCVVSLDEFRQTVAESFTVQFVPRGTEAPDDDFDAPDQIAFDGGGIDLGEAATEQLALALDPYPHKPGVAEAAEPEEGPAGPFAALGRLRKE